MRPASMLTSVGTPTLLLAAFTGCGGGSDGGSGSSSGTGSGINGRPVLVIVGGSTRPTLVAATGSEITAETQGLIDPGEIFVMVRDQIRGSATMTLPDSPGTAVSPLARMNRYRASTGGVTLDPVSESATLASSAIRHAGWQALDDQVRRTASLNHGEPRSNALFTADELGPRIRSANAGRDIIGARFYYEDIASGAGDSSIDQLWNTVYHRIPMMRHRARSAGYGDMALARSRFPSAGVPADDPWNNPGPNGYATINWSEFLTPVIQTSVWPADGAEGVPGTFSTDTESPDPASRALGFASERNVVGPVLHAIFPTGSDFTQIRVEVSRDSAPTWTLSATTAIGETFSTGPNRFTVGP